jgi:hypothetical protein
MAETWLKCTECKTEIPFGGRHYLCSVSTCKRSKFRLVFCSAVCWDSHLSTVRHRDAWAEEAIAPTKDVWQRELAAEGHAAPRAPTPAQGVRPPPVVTTRPGTFVASRPASAVPEVTRAPATADSSQPGRGPAPTADSSQPVRGPAPTSDSVQPRGPGQLAPPPRPSAPPPTTAQPVRRVVGETSPAVAASLEGVTLAEVVDRDILIVVSKMKKYIKDRSGMNCSDSVAEMLSDHVRTLCDDSIRAAARDERKTVLDRDVPRARR